MKKRRKKQARMPLTDQQKLAAKLLFDGLKVYEVAEQIGVHRCTIWRWNKRSDFRSEIRHHEQRRKAEIRRRARASLRASLPYRQSQAAKLKLKHLEKAIERAGNSGNMAELNRLSKEYDRAFNVAYFGGKSPLEIINLSRNLTKPKKAPKPVKYIVEII